MSIPFAMGPITEIIHDLMSMPDVFFNFIIFIFSTVSTKYFQMHCGFHSILITKSNQNQMKPFARAECAIGVCSRYSDVSL